MDDSPTVRTRTGPGTSDAPAHSHSVEYVGRGTVSPTAGAGIASPVGSLYLRDNAGAGELWFKTGAGDTAWTRVTVP